MKISFIENLYTQNIDFTLAFPQTDVESTIFMELPTCFKTSKDGDYVLKLVKNYMVWKYTAKQWFELIGDNQINDNENG